MLSGIQHIAFCERQWAFIHIEQQWLENLLTAEGHILHERVDNPLEIESRGDRQFLRSVPLVSYKLGLYGRADIVELHRIVTGGFENSIEIPGKQGRWKIIPIEYKRGKPKSDDCDRVQLCAQAICLEEMHRVKIPEGFLYYGQPQHRYIVNLDEDLRKQTRWYANRMHELYDAFLTPSPVYRKHCHACSMFDVCEPRTISLGMKASDYINKMFTIQG